MTIAQHSSESNEHYTPRDIVERARLLMGGIDLDPASCEEANKTVKAGMIFTKVDDGLSKPWHGRVFLNPPGGKLRKTETGWRAIGAKDGPGESSMLVFWDRLSRDYESGLIEQAFFVGFTLEILRTSQRGYPVQKYMRCYPTDRIRFNGAGSPTHANVLVFLPPGGYQKAGYEGQYFDRFRNLFSEIGFCERGAI
jgi:hypothetical protein